MHNEKSTAPMSADEPHPKSELSEADFLAREVENAKTALVNTLADLKNGLTTSADLRLWVKRYPWAALGAATVAGFAAGAAVTPAPGQSIREKLSRLGANGRRAPVEKPSDVADSVTATSKASFKSVLLDSLFDLAKTLIQTVILATVRGQGTATGPDPDIPAATSGGPRHARAG
jgi:hypothetical protein